MKKCDEQVPIWDKQLGQASSTTSTQNNTDGFTSNVPKKSWKKSWNSKFVIRENMWWASHNKGLPEQYDWFTSNLTKSSYYFKIRFSWKYLVSMSVADSELNFQEFFNRQSHFLAKKKTIEKDICIQNKCQKFTWPSLRNLSVHREGVRWVFLYTWSF